MCGRYATTRSSADLSALFEAFDATDDGLRPDYNVAPTDPVPIIRVSSAGERTLDLVRWGLVPHWAKDIKVGARMINARMETVATSSAFAPAFQARRCLVPADGWFEWVKLPTGGKQAYFMTPADGDVVVFAGIWSSWHGAEQPLVTCSILTSPAAGQLASVHDRMPVILPRQRWATWLGESAAEATELLEPVSAELLAGIELRPVGSAVGDVRNDGPDLVARVPAPPLAGSSVVPVNLTLF
jgi:putative SOS response-associated peptidase YedK